MSGGVDSSVAAALLIDQDYDVEAMTLQLWGKDVCTTAGSRRCCSVRDSLDAKAVCKKLGIPHHVQDLAADFREKVVDYFIDSYAEGLTPNPCVACNDHIKFGELYPHAEALGAYRVATGHYARVHYDEASGRYILSRSKNLRKDQSYVLFGLTQEQLSRVEFPLGDMDKEHVRDIGRDIGLKTADKPDSQDICFVAGGDKNAFLLKQLNTLGEPGPIEDVNGKSLGEHKGLMGYTIGQREGLGIAVGKAMYVVKLDVQNNRLIVGERKDLLQSTLIADRVNWVSIAKPDQPIKAQVKIRAHHPPAQATVTVIDEATVRVDFDEPQSAITPGQAAVFYDDEVVLGGGWILKPKPEMISLGEV